MNIKKSNLPRNISQYDLIQYGVQTNDKASLQEALYQLGVDTSKPIESVICEHTTAQGIKVNGCIMGKANGVFTELDRKRVGNRTIVTASCTCGRVVDKRQDALQASKWSCTHCPFTESLRSLRAYGSWDSMKQRCTNPKNNRWLHYGARGITYTKEWETFDGFYKDMGERPVGYTLERLDVNGNYCKENCVWSTPQQQSRNQRRRCTNMSGRTGVSWSKDKNKWRTTITVDYKTVVLGYFDNFTYACKIREDAEMLYFGFIKE